jgi:hypothetical protein
MYKNLYIKYTNLSPKLSYITIFTITDVTAFLIAVSFYNKLKAFIIKCGGNSRRREAPY